MAGDNYDDCEDIEMSKFIVKQIPARTEKFEILGGKRNFMQMDQEYRAIRSKSKNPLDKCFFCRHPFEDGEMMGLIMIKGQTNKVVCQECWQKNEL